MKDPATEDVFFMREALKEAQKAFEEDEVPVGAVIVLDEKIIARAYNQVERLNDVTAHAEMLAITAAANAISAKYLNECRMYVTLEPCVMCAGALHWAQISALIYGAPDVKKGYSLLSRPILHPATLVRSGILEKESTHLLERFFALKRALRSNTGEL